MTEDIDDSVQKWQETSMAVIHWWPPLSELTNELGSAELNEKSKTEEFKVKIFHSFIMGDFQRISRLSFSRAGCNHQI
jgi:hypothetical protein